MTGTLELLCGPRAAGKSTNYERKEAFTYTTRDRRKKEVEGIDRRFIDDQTFERLKKQGEIVVDYEFDGHRYGFSRDVIKALQEGRNISEQVGPYDAAVAVSNTFSLYGNVIKRLFLTFTHESAKSATYRDLEPPSIKLINRVTGDYQDHFIEFDEVNFRLFDPEYAKKRIAAMKIMLGKEFVSFTLNYLSGFEYYPTTFHVYDATNRPVERYSPIKLPDPEILADMFFKITENDLLIVSENKRYAVRIALPDGVFSEDEKKLVEQININLFDRLKSNNERLGSFELDKLARIFDDNSKIITSELSSSSIEYLTEMIPFHDYAEYKKRFSNPLFTPCHMAENYAQMFQFKKSEDIMKRCYGKTVSPRIFKEWEDLEGKILSPERKMRVAIRMAKVSIVSRIFGPKYLTEHEKSLAAFDANITAKEFLKRLAQRTRDATDNATLLLKDVWSYFIHGMKRQSFEEYYLKHIKPEMEKYPMIFKDTDLNSPEVIKEIFYIKTMQHYHTSHRKRGVLKVKKDMEKAQKVLDKGMELSRNLERATEKMERLIHEYIETAQGKQDDRHT